MSDVLIVGDSFRNPEIRHEVPVGVPDPFLYVEHGDPRVDGEPLTCERVKAAVERVFSEHGVSSDDPIVSHGPQTAVGHDTGSGPIAPGEPIVLDLYPRDRETGCYADMTRTFVVGTPPDELAEYARLVKEALDRSIAEIRA